MAEYVIEIIADCVATADGYKPISEVHKRIIRCKDCKYCEHYDFVLQCERFWGDRHVFDVEPNDFCSFAEPKY